LFYLSYNSNLIHLDNLLTKILGTVDCIIDQLYNVFKES